MSALSVAHGTNVRKSYLLFCSLYDFSINDE